MPFNRAKFHTGHTFEHIASGAFLILYRRLDNYNCIGLDLKIDDRSIVSFRVDAGFSRSVINSDLIPYDSPGAADAFTVDSVYIENDYRRANNDNDMKVGELMLYIVLHEVKENGGQFLYLPFIEDDLASRFLQCAFMPAPVRAEFLSRLREDGRFNLYTRRVEPISFNTRIFNTRNERTRLLRGSVEISLELLKGVISESFNDLSSQ